MNNYKLAQNEARFAGLLWRRGPIGWVVIAAVIACLAVAVFLLANLTKTLELPADTSVLSIDMEQFNEYESLGAVTVTNSGDIETVLSALSGARKTLRQSVNDYPARNNYLVVKINLSEERRTLCLYSEGNAYFIEEPYVGIYRSTRDSSVAIYKIYTGSHSASRPLSDYIKTAVRLNYRHIGWDSYTMDKDRICFVADALIGALPETLDQPAVQIDNEGIVRDYWEQGSCIELVFDGNTELTYTLPGDIRRSYPCDRMLVCFTKSKDVLFLSSNGVYTHTIGPLNASTLKPVYDWLHGMEFVGYMGPDRAEILGQKITVHRNADLDRLPSGYDMKRIESAMSRSLAFCQAAHFRWYELINRLATEGYKAEIQKWDNNIPSEANDLMQFSNITGVAFPVSVSEPVFLDGDPDRLGVTLGLDENTTVEIELLEGSDSRFLIDSFKVAATGRFERWELNTLGNLGFGSSAQDFEALSPDLIKKIFAPGATPDGAPAFMPDDAQRAELSAHNITEAQSGVLGNLGYSYKEMLELLSEEFNFIFPNTELWEKLAAKGYDTKVLRRPEALQHAGYDSFKALIREALSR